MLEWLRQNSQLVSTLVYMLLLVVWIFYANLLYLSHRRQRTPLVYIHAQGAGPESTCFVSNLSAEPVHIECIALVLELDGKQVVQKITDYARITPERDDHTAIQDVLKQGPVLPGYFLTLGTFDALLRRVIHAPAGNTGAERAQSDARFEEFVANLGVVEIRAVFLHGHFKQPLGAARRFEVRMGDEGLAVRPTAPETRQLSGWRQRHRTVRRWLQDCA